MKERPPTGTLVTDDEYAAAPAIDGGEAAFFLPDAVEIGPDPVAGPDPHAQRLDRWRAVPRIPPLSRSG